MARGQSSQPVRGKSQGVNKKYALRSGGPLHRATQTKPLFDRVHYKTPVVAIDIEFQRYTLLAEPMNRLFRKSGAPRRTQHLRLGRISIVNFSGETVLDTFAYYPENDGASEHVPLTYFDGKFGVTSAALDPVNGAQPGSQVEAWVRSIVRDCVIVLHGGSGDMKAFYYDQDLWEDVRAIVDTQDLWGIKSLRNAAQEHLDKLEVQVGDHCGLEDSQTTMKLFKRFLTDKNLTLEQWLGLNAPVHTHDEDTACADAQ